jgi:peptidoglycan/LPS O-acetylase OafA/YrhL
VTPSRDVAPAASRPWWALDLLDNRYPALHGFRVFAIVSVVQYHVTWIFAEERLPMNTSFVEGSLRLFFGMDLFFLLSGFLIGAILLRSLETTGTLDLGRFYVRRIFRTFPPYYVVFAYLALTTALSAGQRANIPYELLYATNFVPPERGEVVMFWGWSLALEEQFYLVVPALFWVLHRLKSDRSRIALLVALALGALGRRLWMLFRMGPWTDAALYGRLYFRTPTRYDAIVWGVLLALIYQRWGSRIRTALRDPANRAALAIPSLGLLWLICTPDLFGADKVQLVRVFSWGTLTSAMYYGFVLLLLQGEGWIASVLGAQVFRRIATLGYGVYLVHIPLCYGMLVPMARAMLKHHVPMLVVWPSALAAVLLASFVIAYVLHVLIEKPSLRLRQALAG